MTGAEPRAQGKARVAIRRRGRNPHNHLAGGDLPQITWKRLNPSIIVGWSVDWPLTRAT